MIQIITPCLMSVLLDLYDMNLGAYVALPLFRRYKRWYTYIFNFTQIHIIVVLAHVLYKVFDGLKVRMTPMKIEYDSWQKYICKWLMTEVRL